MPSGHHLRTMSTRARLACWLVPVGAALLIALLVVVVWVRPAASAVGFADVPSTHPYHDAIIDLANRGILSGYVNGDFGPGDSVRRMQFAKMIVLAMGLSVTERDLECVSRCAAYLGPLSLPFHIRCGGQRSHGGLRFGSFRTPRRDHPRAVGHKRCPRRRLSVGAAARRLARTCRQLAPPARGEPRMGSIQRSSEWHQRPGVLGHEKERDTGRGGTGPAQPAGQDEYRPPLSVSTMGRAATGRAIALRRSHRRPSTPAPPEAR